MNIEVLSELTPEAAKIRSEVFMEEQGFSYDLDELDKESAHLLVYEDGVPVGTCRFYRSADAADEFILGRLAVRKEFRGQHYGAELMKAAHDLVRIMGGSKVTLSAQVQAQPFYEKLGYAVSGGEHEEEGCPHVYMSRSL